MSTALTQSPTLPPPPARLRPRDPLLVTVEVITGTARAVLVRLPGGRRTTWLPLSVARAVAPDRRVPEGCRMYQLPAWLYGRVRLDLNEPEA